MPSVSREVNERKKHPVPPAKLENRPEGLDQLGPDVEITLYHIVPFQSSAARRHFETETGKYEFAKELFPEKEAKRVRAQEKTCIFYC